MLEVAPNTLASSAAKSSGSRAMVFMSKKKLIAFHVSPPRILDIVSVTESLTSSSKLIIPHPLIRLGVSVATDVDRVGGIGSVANLIDLHPMKRAKTAMEVA